LAFVALIKKEQNKSFFLNSDEMFLWLS